MAGVRKIVFSRLKNTPKSRGRPRAPPKGVRPEPIWDKPCLGVYNSTTLSRIRSVIWPNGGYAPCQHNIKFTRNDPDATPFYLAISQSKLFYGDMTGKIYIKQSRCQPRFGYPFSNQNISKENWWRFFYFHRSRAPMQLPSLFTRLLHTTRSHCHLHCLLQCYECIICLMYLP